MTVLLPSLPTLSSPLSQNGRCRFFWCSFPPCRRVSIRMPNRDVGSCFAPSQSSVYCDLSSLFLPRFWESLGSTNRCPRSDFRLGAFFGSVSPWSLRFRVWRTEEIGVRLGSGFLFLTSWHFYTSSVVGPFTRSRSSSAVFWSGVCASARLESRRRCPWNSWGRWHHSPWRRRSLGCLVGEGPMLSER